MTAAAAAQLEPLRLVPLPPQLPQGALAQRARAALQVMHTLMCEGVHYGRVAGGSKPSLWKPGAELLCLALQFAPSLSSWVAIDDPQAEWTYPCPGPGGTGAHAICRGFFEVHGSCSIHGPDGALLSRASARANNRETQYLVQPVHDLRNTLVKIAEKRALVAAVLLASQASSLFTQDLEDLAWSPRLRRARQRSGRGLTPRREAWLVRAAAGLPEAVLERARAHLLAASPERVGAFFDRLAKGEKVLARFFLDEPAAPAPTK